MKIIPKSKLGPDWNSVDQRDGCVQVTSQLPHSVLPSLLYEVNAWLGGPADRVLIVRSFSDLQPSFDELLLGLLGFQPDAQVLPFGIQFDVHPYENIDQLEEDAAQRAEVQKIIGLLALCLTGDVSCMLRSTGGGCDIDIYDQSINFWYSTEQERSSLMDILARFELDAW